MTRDLDHQESRFKDGREWRIGSSAVVQWIEDGTEGGRRIISAIPPRYEAYATLGLEGSGTGKPFSFVRSEHHDKAVLDVLVANSGPQPWWLGYLETGGSNVVFVDAPRVQLYAAWNYVLVEAGPDQAWNWRGEDWKGFLPDLIFPRDQSWLVSTLWDDDWTCIGGSRQLVDAFLTDPELRDRAREVDPSMLDATPPGHIAL
jgi:hypothetical protein